MRCFVVAGFLLTSASRGPSAIAEPLVVDKNIGGDDSEALRVVPHLNLPSHNEIFQ